MNANKKNPCPPFEEAWNFLMVVTVANYFFNSGASSANGTLSFGREA